MAEDREADARDEPLWKKIGGLSVQSGRFWGHERRWLAEAAQELRALQSTPPPDACPECGHLWRAESFEGEITNLDRRCECGRGWGLVVERYDP